MGGMRNPTKHGFDKEKRGEICSLQHQATASKNYTYTRSLTQPNEDCRGEYYFLWIPDGVGLDISTAFIKVNTLLSLQ
jgi:hypothetical protein